MSETLLRANINDLLAKAEDPEKLARQLVLDMENQLLQVKTPGRHRDRRSTPVAEEEEGA